jgi:hypothetical protein
MAARKRRSLRQQKFPGSIAIVGEGPSCLMNARRCRRVVVLVQPI